MFENTKRINRANFELEICIHTLLDSTLTYVKNIIEYCYCIYDLIMLNKPICPRNLNSSFEQMAALFKTCSEQLLS